MVLMIQGTNKMKIYLLYNHKKGLYLSVGEDCVKAAQSLSDKTNANLLYHKLSSAKIVKVLPNFHMYENHSYPDCASRNWNRGI